MGNPMLGVDPRRETELMPSATTTRLGRRAKRERERRMTLALRVVIEVLLNFLGIGGETRRRPRMGGVNPNSVLMQSLLILEGKRSVL